MTRRPTRGTPLSLFPGIPPADPAAKSSGPPPGVEPVQPWLKTATPVQRQNVQRGLHPCGHDMPTRDDPASRAKCGACDRRHVMPKGQRDRCSFVDRRAASGEIRSTWPACAKFAPVAT